MLGAWGVRGDLKVHPLGAAGLLAAGMTVHLNTIPRKIERSKPHDRVFHVKLAGITNREDANDLRGFYLEVPESELPPPAEGTYYQFQLVGLCVVTTAGDELGRIAEIISTAGNDVFVVRGGPKEVLIPGVDDVVVEVDIAGGRMVIEPVPGLLD